MSARVVGVAGAVAPVLLGVIIAGLSIAQYDFMRALGWHPLRAPMFDWPSGLALGPYGRLLTVAFAGCGLTLGLLATTVWRSGESRAMCAGLWVAGLGMVGLAFDTDPTLAARPATWHGRVHDGGFVVLGLGLAVCWVVALARPSLSRLRPITVLALCALPLAFLLRGAAIYALLAVGLAWFSSFSLLMGRWRSATAAGL